MANWSREKIEWLRKSRSVFIPRYRRLMQSGRLLVECDGRDDVIIIFPRQCFAHLIGFTYFNHHGREIPGALFDDLENGLVSPKLVKYSSQGKPHVTPQQAHDLTEAKIGIAAKVFVEIDRKEEDMWVVESAKSRVILFLGRAKWALGLAKEKTDNGGVGWTGRYVPSSLLNVSVLDKSVLKSGTTPSRVTDVHWI